MSITIFYCLFLRKLESTAFMFEELADHEKRLMDVESETTNALEDINYGQVSHKPGDKGPTPVPDAGTVQV